MIDYYEYPIPELVKLLRWYLLLLYFVHLLLQEWIKRCQQFGFLYHTACAPQDFSIAEEHQRWYRLDAVLACCCAILVHIHLDDADSVAKYVFYLLQNRVHHLTRLAPCSKEINQNKLAAIYYVIECLHNYLSISVKRLKVLPFLVTSPKNIFSGRTQKASSKAFAIAQLPVAKKPCRNSIFFIVFSSWFYFSPSRLGHSSELDGFRCSIGSMSCCGVCVPIHVQMYIITFKIIIILIAFLG